MRLCDLKPERRWYKLTERLTQVGEGIPSTSLAPGYYEGEVFTDAIVSESGQRCTVHRLSLYGTRHRWQIMVETKWGEFMLQFLEPAEAPQKEIT